MRYGIRETVEVLMRDGEWHEGTVDGVVRGDDGEVRSWWIRVLDPNGEHTLQRVPIEMAPIRIRGFNTTPSTCQRCGAEGEELAWVPCIAGTQHVLDRVPA